MRKSKFISVLTSAAMTGATALSAITFTATAADSLVGLKMVSEKTTFTVEELAKGDIRATVYVDSTANFASDKNVTSVEFKLRPSTWGVVDPINLKISDSNAFSTDKTNVTSKDAFNSTLSTTGSIWDTALPTGRIGYSAYNYLDEIPDLVYTDGYEPKATIMTDSRHGKLRAEAANADCHVAEFEVIIPSDAEPGEYTINFLGAQYSAGVLTNEEDSMELYTITNLEPITFTITEDSTDATDPSDTDPTDPSDPSGDDFLLGDANLDGKVNVRDCATIATALAKAQADSLPQKNSDYNQDGKINVRDAAALAKDIAAGTVGK